MAFPDDDVPTEGLGEDTLPNEKLSKTTRKDIGTVGSETRKEQPEDTFLEPGERKYPVKENGKYSHKLLIAAAREARMHGKSEIAAKADKLRAENFGGAKDGGPGSGPRPGGGGSSLSKFSDTISEAQFKRLQDRFQRVGKSKLIDRLENEMINHNSTGNKKAAERAEAALTWVRKQSDWGQADDAGN